MTHIDRPILLTGGSGMVGRNIAEVLMRRGLSVVAPSSRELDLCNAAAVADYVAHSKPELIIHAAGKVGGIQANIAEPTAFMSQNWAMGSNIVFAARTAGVTRFINLGSSCMYPRDHSEPLDEDEVLSGPLELTNEGYAIAKCAVARLCQYANREDSRLCYKTLIPSNVYGRYDHFEPSRSHLVPAIIHKVHSAVQAGLSEVEIWGDGTARREFLYAGDLAEAVGDAVEHFDTLPELTNIGPGTDLTVNEYYEAAARVVGFTGQFVHALDQPVGMMRKLLKVDRASEWGWRAKTSLQEGLALTYQYYLEATHDLPAR